MTCCHPSVLPCPASELEASAVVTEGRAEGTEGWSAEGRAERRIVERVEGRAEGRAEEKAEAGGRSGHGTGSRPLPCELLGLG